ncbi:hypothetical protein BB561_004475 [Smittium simulii]|uniref:Uncharacterized protein n=1 Tax=Smittium simulii TaxID=133385 RepID=A0A2T9YG33_9FUNG|nr:hypothetical protein BB561_004475 [Smittium simulii]
MSLLHVTSGSTFLNPSENSTPEQPSPNNLKNLSPEHKISSHTSSTVSADNESFEKNQKPNLDYSIENQLDLDTNPNNIQVDTGYDSPQINGDKQKDKTARRIAYLFEQTEIFGYFVADLIKNDEIRDKVAEYRLTIQAQKKSKQKILRHRKTEKQEDEELIHGEINNEQTIVNFSKTPYYVKSGQMRDYQIRGLNWMISLYENGLNGILADEMGLGKTLQTISFLGYMKHYRKVNGPYLIVVPKTTLFNWKAEFSKWVPSLNVVLLHGDKEMRKNTIKSHLYDESLECLITTYEMCLICKNQLSKINWKYIIIDEAHRIKNENSSLSLILRSINSDNRMLITGTPLQNNLHELWALLNFLLPDIFESANNFDDFFKRKSFNNHNDNSTNTSDLNESEHLTNHKIEHITAEDSSNNQPDNDNVKQLKRILEPFILRRIKSEVEKALLPKKEINVYVSLTPMQKQWYRRILERDLEAVNGVIKKRDGKMRLLNIVMQLRKCCNHPYLFDGAEPGPPYTEGEHLVTNSGKFIILDKLLAYLKKNNIRVLLFSQMSRVLDIFEDYCHMRDYEFCRIDGNTSHEDRIEAIDTFNAPESSKFIFLLTTRAGGLGINLTTASAVVLFDSDWNPQVDLQAQDRAHRIGQTKQVIVYRFITENAVEEKVLERAMQKLRLDQLVIQNTNQTQASNAISRDHLLSMVQHGAMDIVSDPNSSTNAKDLNGTSNADDEIDLDLFLKRSIEKTSTIQSKYSTMNLDELVNLSGGGQTYAQQYMNNGKDEPNEDPNLLSKSLSSDSVNKLEPSIPKNLTGSGITNSMLWIQPAKRERKINYSVDDYYKEAFRVGNKTPNTSELNKTPRMPKQPTLYDYHFYPKRLHELLELERKVFLSKAQTKGISKRSSSPNKSNTSLDSESGYDKDLGSETEESDNKKMKIDQTEDNKKELVFTAENQKEKMELLAKCINNNDHGNPKYGFPNWSRSDFFALLKLLEKYGDTNPNLLYNAIDGKTATEVKTYLKVFFEKYETELENVERVKTAISKGNQKLEQMVKSEKLIERFVKSVADVFKCKPENFDYLSYLEFLTSSPTSKIDFRFGYSNPKNNKKFTDIEDFFILFALNELDILDDDVFFDLQQIIRSSELFRFNWFIKSRTHYELSKRFQSLITSLNKYYNTPTNDVTKDPRDIFKKRLLAPK